MFINKKYYKKSYIPSLVVCLAAVTGCGGGGGGSSSSANLAEGSNTIIPTITAEAGLASNPEPVSTMPSSTEPSSTELTSVASDSLTNVETVATEQRLEQVDVPDSFTYATERDVTAQIVAMYHNTPMPYTGVSVYSVDGEEENLISTGQTGEDGKFHQVIVVPSHIKSLRVILSAVGMVNSADISIKNNRIEYVFDAT